VRDCCQDNYQGKRVRTVTEFNQQVQSQRDYLLSLDLSINQEKVILVVIFSATVTVRVDSEGLLPSVTFCLV
jgi:hypothetical protein